MLEPERKRTHLPIEDFAVLVLPIQRLKNFRLRAVHCRDKRNQGDSWKAGVQKARRLETQCDLLEQIFVLFQIKSHQERGADDGFEVVPDVDGLSQIPTEG